MNIYVPNLYSTADIVYSAVQLLEYDVLHNVAMLISTFGRFRLASDMQIMVHLIPQEASLSPGTGWLLVVIQP